MKIIFFQNLIAPYRVALFNRLQEELDRGGYAQHLAFEVYFMRLTEQDRSWEIDLNNLKFKYTLGKSLYFKLRSYHFHFNPILLWKMIRSKQDLILGGSWNNFNVIILILLKKLGLVKNTLHIWSEANYLTFGALKKNTLRDKLRKFVFSNVDGTFIIPGKMALITLQKWGFDHEHFVYFPNLIDKSFFLNLKASKSKEKLQNEKPVFFIAARFEERRKGVLNLLKVLGKDRLSKITLKIAGDGVDEAIYKAYVKDNDLTPHIQFLGNISATAIKEELENCDVFVMPSFSDASPLSVIEAIYMQKPLLISDRCGNHFEVVVDGENGKLFDPFNEQSLRNAFDFLIDNKDKFPEMGARSLEIAHQNFDHDKVLNNFIKELTCFKTSGKIRKSTL